MFVVVMQTCLEVESVRNNRSCKKEAIATPILTYFLQIVFIHLLPNMHLSSSCAQDFMTHLLLSCMQLAAMDLATQNSGSSQELHTSSLVRVMAWTKLPFLRTPYQPIGLYISISMMTRADF